MSKPPPNLPSIGDRVRRRGQPGTGRLVDTDDRLWAKVEWDGHGPMICHLHELEKIND